MTLVLILLMCLGIILVGAAVGKPLGWIAIGFAVLAILLAVLGSAGIHVGR
jgi:hypothetical protein